MLEVGGCVTTCQRGQGRSRSGGRVWNTATYRDLWRLALAVGENQAEASAALEQDSAVAASNSTSTPMQDGFIDGAVGEMGAEFSETQFTIGTEVAAEQEAPSTAGGIFHNGAREAESVATSDAVPVFIEAPQSEGPECVIVPQDVQLGASRQFSFNSAQCDGKACMTGTAVSCACIPEGQNSEPRPRDLGVDTLPIEDAVCSSADECSDPDSEDSDLRDPMARYTISSIAEG